MLKCGPFLLVFSILLTCCNNHPAAKPGVDGAANLNASATQDQTAEPAALTIDAATLKKYEAAFAHDTVSYDKKFVTTFGAILRRFSGRKLDTNLLTIGNLSDDFSPDSIYSRVYYARDTVFVESKWIKYNRVLWRDHYADPYTSLDTNLFKDTSRNTWLCFAIGVVYGAPVIFPRSDVDGSVLNLVCQQGLDDLKNLGVHTDKEHYQVYLRHFKGQLLTFGQPESREGVWIWYKPADRMIRYYQP